VVAVAIVNGLVDLACLAYGQCNNWTPPVKATHYLLRVNPYRSRNL
jgi:hypothetical protein